MATREQVAELEAAVRARFVVPEPAYGADMRLGVVDHFRDMREQADLRLARARAACIGEP